MRTGETVLRMFCACVSDAASVKKREAAWVRKIFGGERDDENHACERGKASETLCAYICISVYTQLPFFHPLPR